MAERPKIDGDALINEKTAFKLETAETAEERASRLRREEAEDSHKRLISLIVHIFVMTIVALAFGASVYVLATKDPKTNLPDKAIGIIAAIVAALLGYLTGKGSKIGAADAEQLAPRLLSCYPLSMTDEPQPGMIGPSPSERGLPAVPADPAEHAVDFSQRYAEAMDIATGQVMIDLGLTRHEMGSRDPGRNLEHHTFYPDERDGGGNSPGGQLSVDSGVMNPAIMDAPYGEACGKLWRESGLRDRIQAIIAHERAEHEHGGDHELALIAAPETGLPISERAREILRAQESGWRGR